jgi:putative GTP pyrophosphokinase
MENRLTKGQIRKLGDKIRLNISDISNENLEMLQQYRTSYKETLSVVFTKLTNTTKSVYTESILSYRIKRIDSIIRKLERKPTMQLDRMWDIVGCRCILKNENQIRKLERKIKDSFFVIESQTRDYYNTANPTGYKSLHLYIRLNEAHPDVIEIQLRTKDDHNWATLVEITDLLLDDNAKESEDYLKTKFGHFHKILSDKKNLSDKNTRLILETVIENDLYNLISKTFINNYVEVRSQWVSTEKSKFKNFFVIVSQKDKHPLIHSFSSYEKAEIDYFNQFKNDGKANVLLTHLQNNCYDQISIAYSNYILTTHVFIYDFLRILEDAIIETISQTKYRLYKRYSFVYLEIIRNLSKELTSEINEVNLIETNKENKDRKKDWIFDLEKRISKVNKENELFEKKIDAEIRDSTILKKFILNQITKRNIKKLNLE